MSIEAEPPGPPSILHGCRVHAAPATWVRHPCCMGVVLAAPKLLMRSRVPPPLRLAGIAVLAAAAEAGHRRGGARHENHGHQDPIGSPGTGCLGAGASS